MYMKKSQSRKGLRLGKISIFETGKVPCWRGDNRFNRQSGFQKDISKKFECELVLHECFTIVYYCSLQLGKLLDITDKLKCKCESIGFLNLNLQFDLK